MAGKDQCNSTHHPNICLKGPTKTNIARAFGILAENKEGMSKSMSGALKLEPNR
jgi:hypothetical protein